MRWKSPVTIDTYMAALGFTQLGQAGRYVKLAQQHNSSSDCVNTQTEPLS